MKIALVAIDNREQNRTYNETVPRFGTGVGSMIEGVATMPELELHVISCAQEQMKSPQKLADNIWFHALRVPKIGWLRTLYQGCVRAVRKKVREIQPDIVHGEGTERDCAMCAIYSGFPNVLTIHGNMLTVAKHHHAYPGNIYWGTSARLETFAL